MKNEITYFDIDVNQFLADIPFFRKCGIPSNVIFDKAITECGATTMEIIFARDSIMTFPNVPVIEGKCKIYNTQKKVLILGVYENIRDEEILDYLNSDVPYKKLLVTPESFHRVKEAIGEEMYKKFFLLMDECERTIQDVDYRSSIILPMTDFFKFDNKALISATPINPSDKRFEKNGFKKIALRPTYNYKKEISIINTNNIILSLRQFFNDNPREKYFIFFNSIEGIAEIISKLGDKRNSTVFCNQEESAIFCAKDSRRKLMINGFSHVSTKLKEFKKFNFLTCRFNSAVDIDYDTYEGNPTIIMITDLVFAHHSMIDPLSEAVQIVGRFRRPKDISIPFEKEIIHISNVNPDLKSMDEKEVWRYLDEQHCVHRFVKRFYDGATTAGGKTIAKEMLETTQYSQYINKSDGTRNYYMIDNLIHEERVKGYYQSRENLLSAYRSGKHFIISTKSIEETYVYNDNDRLKHRSFKSFKSINQFISERLKAIIRNYKDDPMAISFEIANLSIDFPKEMAYINMLGVKESAKFSFSIPTIKEHIEHEKKKEENFGFKKYVEKSFKVGSCYTSTQIKKLLEKGLKKSGIKGMSPGVKLLRNFCEVSKTRSYLFTNSNGNRVDGYTILSHM